MNSLFSIAGESLEDPPASGIGKSFENAFDRTLHSKTITIWLWFVKLKNGTPTIFAVDLPDAPGRKERLNSFARNAVSN